MSPGQQRRHASVVARYVGISVGGGSSDRLYVRLLFIGKLPLRPESDHDYGVPQLL